MVEKYGRGKFGDGHGDSQDEQCTLFHFLTSGGAPLVSV
jgi:hypothetical protein